MYPCFPQMHMYCNTRCIVTSVCKKPECNATHNAAHVDGWDSYRTLRRPDALSVKATIHTEHIQNVTIFFTTNVLWKLCFPAVQINDLWEAVCIDAFVWSTRLIHNMNSVVRALGTLGITLLNDIYSHMCYQQNIVKGMYVIFSNLIHRTVFK